MEFFTAFILGGTLCLLFQFLAKITKLEVPDMLVFGLALGGLCGVLGVANILAEFGGAGFLIMVIGAGQGFAEGAQALLSDAPVSLATIYGIFAILTLLGIIMGAVHIVLSKRQSK